MAAILLMLHTPVQGRAESVKRVRYDSIAVPPGQVETFSTQGSSKAYTINDILRYEGVAFGARFGGQRQDQMRAGIERFDRIYGSPDAPLTLAVDPADHNLRREHDPNAGSIALLGVGPTGAEKKNGLGEGAIAAMFDEPVCLLGFQTYLEGESRAAPSFGTPGSVQVSFFDSDGAFIDLSMIGGRGRMAIGFKQEPADPPRIRGILIQTNDVEGIYLDNLRYSSDCLPEVS